MCDCTPSNAKGWLGWNVPAGSPVTTAAAGPWIDLSHRLDSQTPRVPFFPAPTLEKIRQIPEHLINATRLTLVVHTGTHIDSPRHLFNDAPGLDEIPLSRLSGTGLVWPVDTGGHALIEPVHLEGAKTHLAPGEMLILNTGLHKSVGTPGYEDHPYLSQASAQWLLDQGVKLLGVDFPTPDAPVSQRAPGFNYPIHRALLANGILIVEHLTHLDSLNGQRVEVMCNALNITQGDGAPVRMLARPLVG
ncbi:MAG: cyclase family protein [Alcaligenaceae bacterium]|nr:cyclase family protein [Alcaligenaceae bacterium]